MFERGMVTLNKTTNIIRPFYYSGTRNVIKYYGSHMHETLISSTKKSLLSPPHHWNFWCIVFYTISLVALDRLTG